MRVLITGVAGFIGSSLAGALLGRGDEVIGIDNFDPFYPRSIKEENLARLTKHPAFSFHELDILDAPRLTPIIRGADRVAHLAALAGVRPSLMQPARYMRVNVEGTTNVLASCRDAGVLRIVVASSSSVYGSRSEVPFREDDPCNRPASPYAASKRATELVCSNFHDLYDLGVTCLRYFTVYGPRQRPEMAIHKFVRLAWEGKPIPLFGDGQTGRDYTFVDDIVRGTMAALDRQDGRFRIYNLGNTDPVRLDDLIDRIAAAMNRKVRTEPQPNQPGDVPITCADISRAQRELDYRPQTKLDEGLRRFVEWFRRNHADR